MLKTKLFRRTQSAKYRIRRWFAGCVVALFSLASTSVGATTIDFTFTGAVQTFVVPNLVSTIFTETWGAQGWSGSNSGGLGGFTSGDLSVTASETLYVYVGGQGTAANGDRIPMGGGSMVVATDRVISLPRIPGGL